MQFLIRSDDDLALIEGPRRLAGQRDSVIANDIDTHGWGLLICPTAGAAGDPHSRSLCRAKPVYSGRSYGNYWAKAEAWKWVKLEQLPKLVVPFMRPLYLDVLAEFRRA